MSKMQHFFPQLYIYANPMSRGAKIAKTAQFVVLFINIMYDSYVSEFSCSNSSENSGEVHSASMCQSKEVRAEQFSGGPIPKVILQNRGLKHGDIFRRCNPGVCKTEVPTQGALNPRYNQPRHCEHFLEGLSSKLIWQSHAMSLSSAQLTFLQFLLDTESAEMKKNFISEKKMDLEKNIIISREHFPFLQYSPNSQTQLLWSGATRAWYNQIPKFPSYNRSGKSIQSDNRTEIRKHYWLTGNFSSQKLLHPQKKFRWKQEWVKILFNCFTLGFIFGWEGGIRVGGESPA